MASISEQRKKAVARRHRRVRKKISGTADVPRLAVRRTSKHIYAQLVDDEAGRSLAATSTLDPSIQGDLDGKTKSERGQRVGLRIAEIAKEKGIARVAFDRGGHIYHGRVRALADSAREGGLQF